MALKKFKPTSPGRRQLVLVDRSDLHKGKPIKALTEGLRKKGGRNNTGRITARRIGGGHKRRYRLIDFKRTKFDVVGTVERLEYDPNRTAFIALVRYSDDELAYILAPQRLAVGDNIVAAERVDIKPGNAAPLKNIPVGTIVHNVELKAGKVARSHVQQARMYSLLVRTRVTPSLSCPPVRYVWFVVNAWLPSVPCPTRTIRTRTLVKPAVIAGLASVLRFVALP